MTSLATSPAKLIPFTKAHACGNDFLIVSEDAAEGFDKAELALRLCERNTGIGADGVEYFDWTGDFSGRVELYNADGSIAEISGNGTRCVAAWMAEELGSLVGDELSVETSAGKRVCVIEELRERELNGPTLLVKTDMDVPEFEVHTLELSDGTAIDGVRVSMGNPHFVIVMGANDRDLFLGSQPRDASEGSLDALSFTIGDRTWEEIGEEICYHPDFPEQTNIEFVHVLGSDSEAVHQIAIRIFERGVGVTSSSGTGTCAAATAMIGVYGVRSPLEVIAPGGAQTVAWKGPGEKLFLTGPATLIARGEAW